MEMWAGLEPALPKEASELQPGTLPFRHHINLLEDRVGVEPTLDNHEW